VLVLDEGGAALGAEMDAAIAATLRRLAGHLTIIAVTHRPASVSGADQVVVMEGRKVADTRLRETRDQLRP
jgi:ABC-type multidrug transport system fused ATPase/permease subunit